MPKIMQKVCMIETNEFEINCNKENMKLYIVRIESIRHFDDCEYSYLPYYNEIFGVYKTKQDAENDVWRHFGNMEEEYDAVFENSIIDKECPGCDILFKYQDKKYGGIAYYGIFFHEEYLTE